KKFFRDVFPFIYDRFPRARDKITVEPGEITLEYFVTYPLQQIALGKTDREHNFSTTGVVILTRACFAECIFEPLRSKGVGEPHCRGNGCDSHSRWRRADDVRLPFLPGSRKRDVHSPSTVGLIA